jgi:hypothetical protein
MIVSPWSPGLLQPRASGRLIGCGQTFDMIPLFLRQRLAGMVICYRRNATTFEEAQHAQYPADPSHGFLRFHIALGHDLVGQPPQLKIDEPGLGSGGHQWCHEL